MSDYALGIITGACVTFIGLFILAWALDAKDGGSR